MPLNRSNVFKTIRDKRQWHTPPDADAAKFGFRGWHSRGYLPHFDMPGLVQFINYRLDDAMPASRRHEWSALLTIDDDLKRRTNIEDYLDRGCGVWQSTPFTASRQHHDFGSGRVWIDPQFSLHPFGHHHC